MAIQTENLQGTTTGGLAYRARLHRLADGSYNVVGIDVGERHIAVDETTAYRSLDEARQGIERILVAKAQR